MAENKRYYWLKFQKDFFKSLRIKKLRRLAGGDTFTIIYLKLQLLSLTTGGYLEYKGIFDSFEEEMAEEIEEEPDNIKVTVQFLLSCGLMEKRDEKYFLPYVSDNTGSETASTQRSRVSRLKQAENVENKAKLLQCNTNATETQRACNTEKEIEKEIDININNLTVICAKKFAPVVEAWNNLGLNKIMSIDGKRAEMLNARLKKHGLENVLKAIDNINQSSFLRGQNRNSWIINFDWFIRPTNFQKVLEGNYDDQNRKPEKPKTNAFNSFKQNDYDFDDLEKHLLNN